MASYELPRRPTLVSMAQRACIRNVDSLVDVGDVSYDLLRPILKRISNPDQLHQIELASPHIADSDAELWRAFIARDIPSWEEKKLEPTNPRSWWKVYRKLMRDEEKAKEAVEEQLLAQMSGIQKKREENHITFVNKVIPQQRRQAFFVDGKPNPNVRRAGKDFAIEKAPPALRNAKTGSNILGAIKRQSAAAAKLRTVAQAQAKTQILPSGRSQTNTPTQTQARPLDVQSTNEVKPYTPPVMPNAGRLKLAQQPPTKIHLRKGAPTVANSTLDAALRAERARKEDKLRTLIGAAVKSPNTSSQSAASSMIGQFKRKREDDNDDDELGRAGRQTKMKGGLEELPLAAQTATPAPSNDTTSLAKLAFDVQKSASPSPAPVRRRTAAAASVFMPSKKRKV